MNDTPNTGADAPKAPEGKKPSRLSQLSNWLNKNNTSSAKPTGPKAAVKPAGTTKPKSIPTGPKADQGKKRPAGGNKPRGGRSNQGPRGGGSKKRSDHNPLMDKPTHENRDKFHVTNKMTGNKGDIRVVPLGGMEQVGANMMFIEWGDDIILIDTGFLFPDPEHLGIDVLVPDVRYLHQNKHKIKGIIYTHGHLDHIGGVPYVVPELGYPPMYATKLTKEIILANSAEHGITKKLKFHEITPKSKIKLGKFEIEFFHVNHSIPDGVGIVVNTPYGALVHTSDFKIDHNPSDDQPSDLARIAEIGGKGVALAMVDSTNATKDGHTKSEHFIENQIDKVIRDTKGRLIITTFASSVGRVAKVIESAEKYGRTVFTSGRSMEKNVEIARRLNYLKCKDRTVQRMTSKANKMDPGKVLILCTGSQGEELAALSRMSDGRHKDVKLKKEDTIVFSSSPIPGNETAIVKVKNNLSEIGLTTITHQDMDVYVSGHGYKEECKLMTTLLNPKNFAPIHGEMYMRHGHRDMVVEELGFKKERTFVMKNGQGVVLNSKGCRLMTKQEHVPSVLHMVELGEKVANSTLQDRQSMAESGLTVITIHHKAGTIKDVRILSKGYKTLKSTSKILHTLEETVKTSFFEHYAPDRPNKAIEDLLAKKAASVLFRKGKDKPMVAVQVFGG